MEIAPEHIEEIVAHAREDAPDECCGLVAGRDGRSERVFRMENAAHSPLRGTSRESQVGRCLCRTFEAEGSEFTERCTRGRRVVRWRGSYLSS